MADKNNIDKKSNPEKKPKFNIFKQVAAFFRDLKSEIKKIVWPDKGMVFRNMGVVLVTIFIIGVFVCALDIGFKFLLLGTL